MPRILKKSDPLAEFKCEVPASGHAITALIQGPALVTRNDPPGPVRRYRPFSKVNSTLFETFAALPLTDDAIREFADQWGPLGPPLEVETIRKAVVLGKDISRRYLAGSGQLADHTWETQIRLMRRFLDHANGKPDGHPHDLKQKVNAIYGLSCGPKIDWIDLDGAVEVRDTVLPRGLLGALWMQCLRSTAKQCEIRKCQWCKRSFEVSKEPTTGRREDAIYCERKACKQAAYEDRIRRAKQLTKDGLPPYKVAKELGVETAAVKRYLARKR